MSFTRAVTSRPARLAANLGLIQLALFLPFLPGRHDVLAPALSGMAQLIGTAGLKYLVNNPANSILVCEEWNGCRRKAGAAAASLDANAVGHQAQDSAFGERANRHIA